LSTPVAPRHDRRPALRADQVAPYDEFAIMADRPPPRHRCAARCAC